MILAIDIGNTNIVVGCIEEEKIYFIIWWIPLRLMQNMKMIR